MLTVYKYLCLIKLTFLSVRGITRERERERKEEEEEDSFIFLKYLSIEFGILIRENIIFI